MVNPKGGRRGCHAPKSYRPISLFSNTSKLFERIVARRIVRAAIQTQALASTQFGAVENRLAIDALFTLTHPASKVLAIPKKAGKLRPDRPTLLVNDIRGTFNNTDPARLTRTMETWFLPGYPSRWTASFTAHRAMSFCLDGQIEEPRPYDSGLPQGSPVSPVLFLIYAQAITTNWLSHKPS